MQIMYDFKTEDLSIKFKNLKMILFQVIGCIPKIENSFEWYAENSE